MTSYDEARAEVPPDRWLRVRYEDVVEAPRDAFAALLAGMGLTWTDSFGSGFDRYRFSVRARRGVSPTTCRPPTSTTSRRSSATS